MRLIKKITAVVTALSLMAFAPMGMIESKAATGDTVANIGAKITSGSNTNVRSSASTSATIVATLPNNTAITINGYASDSTGAVWFKISSPNTGYIRNDLVTSDSVTITAELNGGGNNVNIRSTPVSGSIVATKASGTAITIKGIVGGSDGYAWYQISTPNAGYVRADLVSKSGSSGGGSTTFVWPLDSAHSNVEVKSPSGTSFQDLASHVNSLFGYRTTTSPAKLHSGIDIKVDQVPVKAAAGGKVTTGFDSSGGNYIKIDHSNGLSTYYFHLKSFNVSTNDTVTQGQTIATSGNTGSSSIGYHLHFGVTKDGTYFNPLPNYHVNDRKGKDGIVNPNPMFVQSNGKYVYNTNFNPNFSISTYSSWTVGGKTYNLVGADQ